VKDLLKALVAGDLSGPRAPGGAHSSWVPADARSVDPAEFKAALEAMRTAGIEIDGLSPDYAIGGHVP
jgi:hypothetical protein